MSPAFMDCLDDGQVMDFVHHQLTPEAMRAAEAHLDGCDACRALVAEAVRSSSVKAPPMPEGEVVQSAHFAVAPVVGDVLADRFRLDAVLGRGGMGVVYRARDLRLDVTVALKLIAPGSAKTGSASARQLVREMRLTRSINHPSVCRVFDVGDDDKHTFITMELVEGTTLETAAARDPFTTERATHILVQVCHALEAAHQEKVVHRDLKPSNIMLTSKGDVKVMDFGLARDLSADASASTQGGAVGTPAYWAPEQARGEAATFQSDLYSLGLIAYRLLARDIRAPFPKSEDLRRLKAPYGRIIRRALDPDAKRRFPSVSAFRAELEFALRSQQSSRFVAPIAITAGILFVAGLIAAAALSLLERQGAAERAFRGIELEPLGSAVVTATTTATATAPTNTAPALSVVPTTEGSTSAAPKASAAMSTTKVHAPAPPAPPKKGPGRTVVPVVD
ncbi:MAG: protein kinase [Polyangiaceae bacterium]